MYNIFTFINRLQEQRRFYTGMTKAM